MILNGLPWRQTEIILSFLRVHPSTAFRGKASAYNAGDLGSVPGLGRSPGEGYGNPPQYSCLGIPWTEDPGGLQSMVSQKVRKD